MKGFKDLVKLLVVKGFDPDKVDSVSPYAIQYKITDDYCFDSIYLLCLLSYSINARLFIGLLEEMQSLSMSTY